MQYQRAELTCLDVLRTAIYSRRGQLQTLYVASVAVPHTVVVIFNVTGFSNRIETAIPA